MRAPDLSEAPGHTTLQDARPGSAVSAPRIVHWQDAPAQPWRNGGGLTRVLLTWPDTEAWQCRLSVADITRAGPFSAFPGVTRWFAVLDGEGVVLRGSAGARTLRAGDPALCFDGAQAPDCTLIDGPTRDLNLMLRGAEGRLAPVVDRQAWSPAEAQSGATLAGVFALVDGHLDAGQGDPVAVPAMSLCWWPGAPRSLVFRTEAPGRTRPLGWWWEARA
jgi:uncharacterized protein